MIPLHTFITAKQLRRSMLLIAALTWLCSGVVTAQVSNTNAPPAIQQQQHTEAQHAQHQHDAAVTAAPAAPPRNIPDVLVRDQDGRERRFFTDLVKGKIVAISFIFTTCTTACPVYGKTFAELQNLLGARLGQDINLITVTTDPANDTPARLKEWAARFGGAKPGWTLITGASPEVNQLLQRFQGTTARQTRHAPLVLLYNTLKAESRTTHASTPPAYLKRMLTEW